MIRIMTMQDYSSLTIANDFMFGHVMRDKNLCMELLRRIFPRFKIVDITYPLLQKSIRNSVDSKGVRLDVYVVEGEHKRVYDIEMQTSDTKELPERSRYYLDQIDMELLHRGQRYKALPNAFVIFICPFDLFGDGLHINTVRPMRIERPHRVLDDRTTRIFLNTNGTANDCSKKLKAFLNYVNGIMSNDPYVEQLNDAVNDARNNEEWRLEYMKYRADIEDAEDRGEARGRAKGRAEGKAEGRAEGLAEGLAEGKDAMIRSLKVLGIPLETIAQASKMSLEYVQALV